MSKAENRSLDYIKQTCPIVDKLESDCLELITSDLLEIESIEVRNRIEEIVQNRISTMVGKIKEQATEKLREALIDCCQELINSESEVSDLERTVDEQEDRIESLIEDVEYWENKHYNEHQRLD